MTPTRQQMLTKELRESDMYLRTHYCTVDVWDLVYEPAQNNIRRLASWR